MDVVVEKLRQIDEYADDLEEMRGLSQREYLDDVVTQRAVERTLMNLVQAALSMTCIGSSDLRVKSPDGYSRWSRDIVCGCEVIGGEPLEKQLFTP